MTNSSSFKREVRARMMITGQTYMQAMQDLREGADARRNKTADGRTSNNETPAPQLADGRPSVPLPQPAATELLFISPSSYRSRDS